MRCDSRVSGRREVESGYSVALCVPNSLRAEIGVSNGFHKSLESVLHSAEEHPDSTSLPAHNIRKFAVQGDRSVAYVLHCDDCQLGIGCMLKKSSGKSNCILSISYPHKYNIRLLKCIFKVIINTVSYNGICFYV